MSDLSQRAEADGLVRRSFSFDEIEVRSDDSNGFTVEGIASVVDHPYPVRDQWGTYTETIKAGAFKTSLSNGSNISLYYGHRSTEFPFANTRSGTLQLKADPHLRVVGTLDPVRPDVQILRSVVANGLAGEMSIGFMPVKARDKWSQDMTEVVRTQVNLREVSIVEQGANTGGTAASMRSFDQFMESLTEVEMTEDEIQRAIAYFSDLLPRAEEPGELVNPFADRDRQDRERLERKRHLATFVA